LLSRLLVDRSGWDGRMRMWSPPDSDYFTGMPAGLSVLMLTGMVAADLLLGGLLDARPAETDPGAAREIYEQAQAELLRLLEQAAATRLSAGSTIWEVASNQLFGVRRLLHTAAGQFAAVRRSVRLPSVLLVGEIFVRLNAFANGCIVDQLEQSGCRVRLAPMDEWLEYCQELARQDGSRAGWVRRLSAAVQNRIRGALHDALAGPLGWPGRSPVQAALSSAQPYMPEQLYGEAVLTLGTAIHQWREGTIDGVVSVGPHECMPNKIAEAQFFHVAEQEGLLSLTIPAEGGPLDTELLENFVFEVKQRLQNPGAPLLRARAAPGSPCRGCRQETAECAAAAERRPVQGHQACCREHGNIA
jgi:hypothetical protein